MDYQWIAYRVSTFCRRLFWPTLCRYCDGPLDAEDIRCVLMCDRCCREERDVAAWREREAARP